MIAYHPRSFIELVIDDSTYSQNIIEIDELIEKTGLKSHFMGIQFHPDHKGEVFVWLFSNQVDLNRIQALSDDITYLVMDPE